MIKHIQELAKTFRRFVKFQALYVGGWGLAAIDRLATESVVLEMLAEKESLGLKHITAKFVPTHLYAYQNISTPRL